MDYKFLILVTYHLDTVDVSKDVRIHSCFSALEGVYEQKCLGDTVLDHSLLGDPFSFLEVDKDGFCFLCGNKLMYCTSQVRVSIHMLCLVSILNILHLDWINLQLLMELQSKDEL